MDVDVGDRGVLSVMVGGLAGMDEMHVWHECACVCARSVWC